MYEKIFELLKKKGISQYQLSKAVKISAGNISDWKNNRSEPSVKALKKIADFLEVPIEYFFDENKGSISIVNNGGYNEINGIKNISISNNNTDIEKEEYISKWNSLNKEGQKRLLEQAELLLGKYKK